MIFGRKEWTKLHNVFSLKILVGLYLGAINFYSINTVKKPQSKLHYEP